MGPAMKFAGIPFLPFARCSKYGFLIRDNRPVPGPEGLINLFSILFNQSSTLSNEIIQKMFFDQSRTDKEDSFNGTFKKSAQPKARVCTI